MADPWGYGAQSSGQFGSYVPLQQKQQQQQSGGMPQMNPMQAYQMYQNFAPASSAAGGASGAGGGAGAGASGGAGGAGSAASGGGGMWSSLASFWPAAIVAAAIANENYQGNIGNRDNEGFTGEYALTGRSFYKDAPGWGEKADEVLPGLGSGVRIAGNLSSPADLFRGETYSNLWDDLKSGGTVGNVLKGLF